MSRWTPTDQILSSGAVNDCSAYPAAVNQPRIAGVRSGSRRCRVQTTVALRCAEPGERGDRARGVLVADVAQHAAQQQQVGGRAPGVRVGAACVGAPDRDARQVGGSRRGGRGEVGVQLDQGGRDPGSVRPAGQHAEQVAAVAGADAGHHHRPGLRAVEPPGDLRLDHGESLGQRRGRVGVVGMPGPPVGARARQRLAPGPTARRRPRGSRAGPARTAGRTAGSGRWPSPG